MRSAWGCGVWLFVGGALACATPATQEAPPAPTTGGAESATIGDSQVARCSVPHSPALVEYEEGMRAARAGELERARRLLAVACDTGNPCACTEVGESFIDPPDGSRDIARGARLLERGCAGGDVWGCYELGSAIFRFIPDRVEHARDLFEDACDDGLAEACLETGRFRMTGVDGDESAIDALQFYDRACNGGVHYACVVLGEAFAEGIGTRRDPRRAAELLSWSCNEVAIAPACRAWAEHLDVSDDERSALLRRACDGGDAVACDLLDPEASHRGGEPALRALAASVPSSRPVENGSSEVELTIGGNVDLRSLGLRPACVGFVGTEPNAVLAVPEGSTELTVAVRAAADAVLAIRDPSGRWICADDGVAGHYDPRIEIGAPLRGDYLVWAGTLDREPHIPARLRVDAVAPVIVVQPVTYESLPEPELETFAMPDQRLRFYHLEASAMPGLTGRIRVDGRELWSFENRGGRVSLEEIQCALTPGTHTLDIEIVQRGRDAHLVGNASALVQLTLYGSVRRRPLPDEGPLYSLAWSPDAPGRRRVQFVVERRQAGDQTSCR